MPSQNRTRPTIQIVAAVTLLAASVLAQPDQAPPAATQPQPTPSPSLPPSSPDDRARRWQEDLDFLASELPKRHPSPFFKCGEEDFKKAAADFRAEIPDLTDHQVIVGMMRLVARLGDGQTQIPPGRVDPPFHFFPLSLVWCRDGLYIAAAREAQKDLIGSRLASFGNADAADACLKVAAACALDNDPAFWTMAPRLLVTAEIAHAVGLIPSPDRATATVRSADGAERTIELAPMTPGEKMVASETPMDQLPRWRQRRTPFNWYEYLPEHKTVYFHYGRAADEPTLKVVDLINDMLKALDAYHAERIIIDLRANTGGAAALAYGLIIGLTNRPAFNRPGSGAVIVLTCRFTSGAAQSNAAKLKKDVGAVHIGEPPALKPNRFANPQTFYLPNSRLPVQCATEYVNAEPAERPVMQPDVRIDMTAADFFTSSDPAFDAAINYRPASP